VATLRVVTTLPRSAAGTLLAKWDDAQRAHQQVCRDRLALIAQRHRELLELVGYYEGVQLAYERLREMRSPAEDALQR